MESSSPANVSKRKRIAKFVRHKYDRARDAISSQPAAIPEASDFPGSSTLATSSIYLDESKDSLNTLGLLVGLEERRVRISLEPLRSVLHIQDEGSLVSALHASFPDYMFDKERSTIFFCDQTQHNEILANGCFNVMKSQLRFNICHLESSFVFDKDIADMDERIQIYISRGLSYACRYWGDHLREGSSTDAVHGKLVEFLTERLLFWMEVLNLEGRIVVGGEILQKIWNWLDSSRIDAQKQSDEAKAFLTRFTASACTRGTPHIYIAALPLCPRSSSVYKNYWKRTQGLIEVKGSAIEQLSNAAVATWTTDSRINSIAFTPDGTRIVSGSNNTTVRVWDAHTGDVVAGPFTGHTQSVNSVAFSPDGARIVSGSEDKTICIWDASTGNAITGPFAGHTDSVNSVAFSPDGTRIVSGSYDQTIQIWDACTGNVITRPFTGNTGSISSVAFSPDGTRIVSGSFDNTIRVWDMRTGNAIAGPFTRHTQSVSSVSFSPDDTCIVSGSEDKTICVWDAPFTRHTQSVSSVTFSPDGTCIVSGSSDQTIRVWDVYSSNAEPSFTEIQVSSNASTSSSYVEDFIFNKDGWLIADKIPLFWVSPHFLPQMPQPRNRFVIGPRGTTFVDYHGLNIGNAWSQCFR